MALELDKNNPFSSLTRSSQQVREIFELIIPEKIPEIAEVKSDPYYQGLLLIAYLFENIHYYGDRYFREAFQSTARMFSSSIKHAKAKKFRVPGKTPSKVTLTFTLDSPAPYDLTIPKNTISTDGNETQFMTVQEAVIPKNGLSASVLAKQYYQYVENELISTTDGTRSQKFVLPDDVSDEDIALRVDGENYNFRENFYPATSIDKIFVAGINTQRKMEITLGDGFNGFLPEAGRDIFIDYYLTGGAEGNVPVGTINKITSQITLPDGVQQISVSNQERSSGGLDIMSSQEINRQAPLVHLKHGPAVNENGYKRILEQYPGVARAGLSYEFGSEVSIYVVMQDGLPAAPSVLTAINDYLSDGRQIILIDTVIKAAGAVKVIMSLSFTVSPNAYQNTTVQQGQQVLQDFFRVENQEVSGKVSTFDIQKTLSKVPNIASVKINELSLIPYARPEEESPSLDWICKMKNESRQVQEWRISFVSTTSFQVYRKNTFEGTFQINQMVTFDEVEFEIRGGYDPGNEWVFKTYPYLGNQSGEYQLEEPSVFVLDPSTEFFKIQASGGIE